MCRSPHSGVVNGTFITPPTGYPRGWLWQPAAYHRLVATTIRSVTLPAAGQKLNV